MCMMMDQTQHRYKLYLLSGDNLKKTMKVTLDLL